MQKDKAGGGQRAERHTDTNLSLRGFNKPANTPFLFIKHAATWKESRENLISTGLFFHRRYSLMAEWGEGCLSNTVSMSEAFT